jgi:Mrp family chromosome partitioning ATPase
VARRESEEFVLTVRSLENHYDFILLDAPVAATVIASDTLSEDFAGVLLVVHASKTSKSAAREATDDLLEAEINLLGVVLNGAS